MSNLEDRADQQLGAQQSHIEDKIARADADLSIAGKYESTCRIIAAHERSRDHIQEIRNALECSMEACGEDLRALLERVRAGR
jgi:hypothetical protein